MRRINYADAYMVRRDSYNRNIFYTTYLYKRDNIVMNTSNTVSLSLRYKTMGANCKIWNNVAVTIGSSVRYFATKKQCENYINDCMIRENNNV